MVGQVSWIRADADETVGKRVGDIFGDMVWVTTGWAEVGTFSTWLDVQVGLDEPIFCNGDNSVKERNRLGGKVILHGKLDGGMGVVKVL